MNKANNLWLTVKEIGTWDKDDEASSKQQQGNT